jgi:hypothetical protein
MIVNGRSIIIRPHDLLPNPNSESLDGDGLAEQHAQFAQILAQGSIRWIALEWPNCGCDGILQSELLAKMLCRFARCEQSQLRRKQMLYVQGVSSIEVLKNWSEIAQQQRVEILALPHKCWGLFDFFKMREIFRGQWAAATVLDKLLTRSSSEPLAKIPSNCDLPDIWLINHTTPVLSLSSSEAIAEHLDTLERWRNQMSQWRPLLLYFDTSLHTQNYLDCPLYSELLNRRAAILGAFWRF